VFTLRYTGFRGEDAACLPTDALDGDHIKVETGKTDEVVWILAPVAAAALRSIKPKTRGHFFWTGAGERAIARSVLYRKMKRLFKLAGMPNAHPHQFRDTFACELLQQGVPIKDVSMMLGHQSVVVTEKYYSKWVHGRQEALDAQVTRAMGADQIAKEAIAWYGSGTQGASAETPVDYKEVVMEPRAEVGLTTFASARRSGSPDVDTLAIPQVIGVDEVLCRAADVGVSGSRIFHNHKQIAGVDGCHEQIANGVRAFALQVFK
jgi:hypothetical protein